MELEKVRASVRGTEVAKLVEQKDNARRRVKLESRTLMDGSERKLTPVKEAFLVSSSERGRAD
jgi:hypothetical protein